jgi:hypothetical protein
MICTFGIGSTPISSATPSPRPQIFGVGVGVGGATSRWAGGGIVANAVMPGPTYTGFQRNMDPDRLRERTGGADVQSGEVPAGWKTLAQGAATRALLAASPLTAGISGRYFEDCNEALPVRDGNGYSRGVAPYALDADNAERLWLVAEALLQAHALADLDSCHGLTFRQNCLISVLDNLV